MKRSSLISIFAITVILAGLFGPGAAPVSAGGGPGVIYIVNSVNNAGDANKGDGICATSTGKCTLRAAIQEANFDAAFNTIQFNLPGAGPVYQIMPGTELPDITQPLSIDGTSQPNCSVPCVGINGTLIQTTADGLSLLTDGSAIRGLAIIFFNGTGIVIAGDGNYILSNYIGVWPGDSYAHPNGIGITVLGSSNHIGGPAVTDRNVISGNSSSGIIISHSYMNVTSNIVQGNYIGLDPSGTIALGNGVTGLSVLDPAINTLVGGSNPGEGNVISGNGQSGIYIQGNDTVVKGNIIGTKADGTGSLGNGTEGIRIKGDAVGIMIGGNASGSGNRIARNGGAGILVTDEGAGQVRMRGNRIYLNGGLGIDLNRDGVTANDPLDADTGPNSLQNYPVIISASSSTSEVVLKLYSHPSSSYTIDFYSSPAGTCDPGNHGEGKKFLGSKLLTTDTSGYNRIRFVSPVSFAAGSVITATATDNVGRTSEFSSCRTAQ